MDTDGLFIGKALGYAPTAWGAITAGGPGALIGGVIGGVVGGVRAGLPGAIVGGLVGGVLGSLLDPVYAGKPGYGEEFEFQMYLIRQEGQTIDEELETLRERMEPMLRKLHINEGDVNACY